MVIGGHTLEYTPDGCTLPRAQRSMNVVETYSSVQIFDWGLILPGTLITINWDLMSTGEFNTLDALYVAGATIEWDSEIQSKKYNVVMQTLTGKLIDGADGDYRQDVEMQLVIISEVTT